MSKRKVVLIGLDSATFDIIKPMVAKGELPNFKRLMQEGVHGELQSTLPPVTPLAWTSMVTGKNPGKHGIFDFYATPDHGYERPLANANMIRAKGIWTILTENGRSAGSINCPLTHPPKQINGFQIPGMQYSLDSEGNFAYPKGIVEELEEAIGAKYEVVYGDAETQYLDRVDKFLAKWREINEKRIQSILYLMDHHPVDFFMPVFYSIDAIQHVFWKHFDPTHPLHDPKRAQKYGDVIPEFYRSIDGYIGQILDKVDETNTTVMVASDHGAGPQYKGFYLNKWLMDEGYLVVKDQYKWMLKNWGHLVFKVAAKLGNKAIGFQIPIKAWPILRKHVDAREGLKLSEIIDWSKTKAFAGNYTEQGLYINLQGREPEGIVAEGEQYRQLRSELVAKMKKIIDPDNGQPLFSDIMMREDVYEGSESHRASDVFFTTQGGGQCLVQPQLHYGLFRPVKRLSGTHALQGMFIMKGPGVKAGEELTGLKIEDVAATALYQMDEPVPEDMDGRVMESGIDAEALRVSPIQYGKGDDMVGVETSYSKDEAAKMEETLRNLGYL